MEDAFSVETRFSTASSQTTWHTLPVGAAATSVQLGALGMGVRRALEVAEGGSWLLERGGGVRRGWLKEG